MRRGVLRRRASRVQPLSLPSTSRAMESSLPLPTELRSLVAQLAALQLAIEQNRDLLSRLASLLDARAVGHERMDLPVDLGLGYSVDGVV